MIDGEFRPIPPERLDEYERVVDYAFTPENGPGKPDDPDDPAELADQPGERFGVFVDSELRSVCKHYEFEAHLRGTWTPLVGLAAVATPPEHRRQSYVSRAISASLDRWRNEYPLSALWPFDRAYYEQFGWATANTVCEYQIPVDQLSFARGTAEGRPTRVDPDDWERLNAAYEAHVGRETLGLRRDEQWWRERVLDGDDGDSYVYAWEHDGEVRGYVVYTVESTGERVDDRRVEVSDLAAADDEAFRGLLGFLADHDSQATEVKLYAPDDTLLDRVPAPGDVECRVHTGPMVRVVDVADALSTVPYPAEASATLTLRVTDDTAAWNDGTVRLDVSGGEATCERVPDESGADTGGVDVTVGVGTLSQLVVGYRDVAALRRVGDIAVDEETAADLARLFPPERVALRDFF